MKNKSLKFSAACTGASVSYYAHQVVQEYFNPVLPYNNPLYLRFEYGSALFIGWVSLVIGKLTGFNCSSPFLSGVLSSVISSAASLMVLSKIAKGEIIQSGYLKKHLGKSPLVFKISISRLQTTGGSAHSERFDSRRPRICVISSLLTNH